MLVPESVRHRCLLLSEDFGDDQQVVEEEHLALMQALPLLLVDVGDLVEPAVADESSVWKRQVEFFADDRLLHFHDLRDMVRGCLELRFLDALVDAEQHVLVDVHAVVDAAQVFDEVFRLHPTVGLHVRRMEVGVQHNDGEGKHKDLRRRKFVECLTNQTKPIVAVTYRIWRSQLFNHVWVAHAVAVREHLHESLDFLRFAGHPEVALELLKRHVDGEPREVHLLGEVLEDRHVERLLQVAEVLADHLAGEALARDEELRDGVRRVLEEVLVHQVGDPLLRLLVEQIQADAVLALADRLGQLRLQLHLVLLLNQQILLQLLLLHEILLVEELLLDAGRFDRGLLLLPVGDR